MPFFRPNFEKHLTILLYGPRSAGKSLHQAWLAASVFKFLDKIYRAYPKLPQAIVMSNQVFNKKIEDRYMAPFDEGKKRVKHMDRRLWYWESIRQLRYCPRENCWKSKDYKTGLPLPPHRLHDAYVIFDDIATIIPSDGWRDLPVWFRKMFAQAGHNGIHCIANIQDPLSGDINFRRYVDMAYKVKKIMGSRRPEEAKPPVKVIWGFYMTRRIAAEELFKQGDLSEEEIAELRQTKPDLFRKRWVPSLHWIGRKKTEIYNTLQNVPEYMPNRLEHIELKCEDPECDVVHTRHRTI